MSDHFVGYMHPRVREDLRRLWIAMRVRWRLRFHTLRCVQRRPNPFGARK